MRRMKPYAVLAREHVIAIAVFALIATGAAAFELVTNPQNHDLVVFYQSGQAALAGSSYYVADSDNWPNLNPPLVVVAIFAPLAVLPIHWAALVWTLAGLIALGVSLRVVARELRLSRSESLVAACVLLALPGALLAWREGQVTWFLLYPVTRAWAAYRHERLLTCGAWLVPVIAAKPFLGVAALALGAPVAIAAGFGSLALYALSIPVTGWQAWMDWSALSGQVYWLAEPLNASLPGALARLLIAAPSDPVRLSDLPPAFVGVWICAGLAVIGTCYATVDRNARYLVALLGAILVAPLGWGYYLPLGVGAAVGWYRQHRTVAPLLGSYLPWGVYGALVNATMAYAPSAYPLIGSWYTLALLALWLSVVRFAARVHAVTGIGQATRPAA